MAIKTLPHVSWLNGFGCVGKPRRWPGSQHEHLALIFGAETWRGTPTLVSSCLIDGTLLADRLRRRRFRLSPREVDTTRGLAGALPRST